MEKKMEATTQVSGCRVGSCRGVIIGFVGFVGFIAMEWKRGN